MKRLIAIVALVLMVSLPFATMAEQDKVFKVGIAQFAEHGSLDNTREGFILGMKESGFEEGVNVTYNYLNASAKMDIAASIASVMVDGGSDLIVAIATPMAKVAFETADDKIPVIYSVVSFPVSALLSDVDGLGMGNTTGTSDRLPVAKQLTVMREMLPDAKTIGILYTLGEVNSVEQVKEYEELAPEHGFEILAQGITAGQDIPLAVPGLISKSDCVTMVLDNTVVQYLDVVLESADEAKIPVFGSEIEQVKRGCVAAQGLDYIELGRMTGVLAARVLKGEDAASIPFQMVEDSQLYVNFEACERLGITLTEDLTARAIRTEAE